MEHVVVPSSRTCWFQDICIRGSDGVRSGAAPRNVENVRDLKASIFLSTSLWKVNVSLDFGCRSRVSSLKVEIWSSWFRCLRRNCCGRLHLFEKTCDKGYHGWGFNWWLRPPQYVAGIKASPTEISQSWSVLFADGDLSSHFRCWFWWLRWPTVFRFFVKFVWRAGNWWWRLN